MKQLILFIGILLILSGCGKQTAYHWGNYENNLYSYYKSPGAPENHELYMTQLLTIIEKGEKKRRPTPPGIYAEYGFGLYKIGKHQEAIQYFEYYQSLVIFEPSWKKKTHLREFFK